MKKLILHIGTAKTGTTSIQNWGRENRQALRQQGVWYSQSMGDSNHTKIYQAVLRKNVRKKGLVPGAPALNSSERQGYRDAIQADLKKEVLQAEKEGAHTFIISNEHCHSRLVTDEEVEDLKLILAPLFEEILIVCCLRPQVDVAVSLASTASKSGWIIDKEFFERVSESSAYFNYEKLIKRWGDAFQYESLNVVPFKRNANMVKYFMELLKLSDSGLKEIERANESLDVRSIAVANMLNRSKKDLQLETDILNFQDLHSLSFQEPLVLNKNFAKEIHERVVESNNRLLKNYACMQNFDADDLIPNWSKYDDYTNLNMLEDNFAYGEHLYSLVVAFEKKVRFLQAKEAVAVAELAFAKGDKGAVKEAVACARQNLKALRGDKNLAKGTKRLNSRIKALLPDVITSQ